MRQKRFLKATFLLILIAVYMTSCDNNKIDIQISKIVINNEGEFEFQDSILYLVYDSLQYQVKIVTEPADAEIYYTKNETDFIQISGDWITIDSTFQFLRFYARKQDYNETSVSRIDFGFGEDNLIPDVQVYPLSFTDTLHYTFNSYKLRGKYFYKVNHLIGDELMFCEDFISEDNIEKNINVDHLSPGIYLVRFNFGNTILTDKVVKR